MLNKLKIWIKAIRAPFFTATVLSGILGSIIAWYYTGNFNWGYFGLTLLGIILLNTGTNLINDYFDHTSNLDEINRDFTLFSGGSRVIQDKLLSPKKIFCVGIISFALAGIVGLYLNYQTAGNIILIIGIIGVFLGYFYTAHPLRIGYTPLGEIVTGFCCGPLIVCGSFYVQAQTLSWRPFFASIPVAVLVGLILFINEFQDYEADKTVGKRTLVVLMGKKKAVKVYYFLLGFVYLWIISGIAAKIFPYFSLIILITFPLCVKAIKVAKSNYEKIYELLPANAATIGLHLTIGILLSASYILDRLVKQYG